jgi:lipoate-protein ligase A
MTLDILTTDQHFDTAEENMRFDESLLERLIAKEYTSFYRFYEWQHPGLTFTHSKSLPEALHHLDHAKRATGGGIVFHSPGDIVFSIGIQVNDPAFPKSYKDTLCEMTKRLTSITESGGLETSPSKKTGERNLMFCNSYYNPYEREIDGEKTMAIAMRKFRDVILFQGVIHLKSNRKVPEFYKLDKTFHTYFTNGVEGQLIKTKDLNPAKYLSQLGSL